MLKYSQHISRLFLSTAYFVHDIKQGLKQLFIDMTFGLPKYVCSFAPSPWCSGIARGAFKAEVPPPPQPSFFFFFCCSSSQRFHIKIFHFRIITLSLKNCVYFLYYLCSVEYLHSADVMLPSA